MSPRTVFAAAAELYEVARERLKTHSYRPDASQESVARYDVTYNNLSLAQAEIGDLSEALGTARLAVKADPMSPVARETEAFALARLGRYRPARAALSGAVDAAPGQFPAWNDLGVVDARLGDCAEAVRDFRRAMERTTGLP